MREFLGLVGFAVVVTGTPGPNNSLLLASGLRFGFRRSVPHVTGTAIGVAGLIAAAAAGIAVVVLAVPGADLALRIIGSAYLIYLAFRVVGGLGVKQTTASRPLGVWSAVAFQFANPKVWLLGVSVASTFRLPALAPVAAALTLTATCSLVALATAAVWAAGGAALQRVLQHPTAQRAVSITLAVVIVASVALIWI
jgi:threonine/homoserine/homoserine lactone efflux protein